MYILSKKNNYLHVPARLIRNAQRLVFNVPGRILPKYERSPYYIASKLGNYLDIDTQRSDHVFAFKKKIAKDCVKYQAI